MAVYGKIWANIVISGFLKTPIWARLASVSNTSICVELDRRVSGCQKSTKSGSGDTCFTCVDAYDNRACASGLATLYSPMSPAANTTATGPDQCFCQCPHKCSIRGKWIPERTFYAHQRTTREQGNAATGTAGLSSSLSRRRAAPQNPAAPATQSEEIERGASEQENDQDSDVVMSEHEDLPYNEPSPPPEYMNIDSPSASPIPAEPPAPNNIEHTFEPDNHASESEPKHDDEPPKFTLRDFELTNKFIELLRTASLDGEHHGLDKASIEQLRHPLEYIPQLTPDERFSIDLLLSLTNASEKAYNSVRDAVLRRHIRKSPRR
ncbi:hypothetical protein FB45DRAFT_1049856 [Roridomyces roridus]|uniref:Uncharacterized protein n=1 Tax=Roridomyces roridus TaxID=1738132 RepID=A0AAD7CHS9_9AGAR|nr:hypothetical protein FB45DRAFT_1049856 [Roridomyces roridus]